MESFWGLMKPVEVRGHGSSAPQDPMISLLFAAKVLAYGCCISCALLVGSVVGPMIYGMAFWHPSEELAGKIPKDFNDSKQLSEAQRHVLLETILETPEMGFGVRVLPASEISRNMLRSAPYNLNQMSHDAAIELIRSLVDAKVAIQTCYIDTVGNPASYRRRLEQEFPGIEFIVESKADDNYAPCSAASIGERLRREETHVSTDL
jgi:ribonuclease H2 subunit A